MIYKSPAKLNLGLSIIKKLNHYHQVKCIYTQISLFDYLSIRPIKPDTIKINIKNCPNLPTDNNNLIYQAVNLLKQKFNIKTGVSIKLIKNIPIGSGLGGGSSNAAVVLKALNKIWHLNLSLSKLINLAKPLGMDLPFSLVGGVKSEIQGDTSGKLISLPSLPKCYIVLCFPDIFISTTDAFQQVDYQSINKNNLNSLASSIKSKNLKTIGQHLHNDFNIWTPKKFPVINQIKSVMINNQSLGVSITGKGPTVFGIFYDFKSAKKTKSDLISTYKNTFLVKPF
ncbi:MAG: 4-(cytidine 5'-diphospho)-2-C-methyl-D-erythritol kinase [Candidatus Shapirobacteria bacterium]|nr:4-(cytidine 5'-diphospho)-2-C-methyl-D-erythritol kinase [Candidatus Shapirobacteria bacterium]